ncbi:hypothetical protein V8F06_012705 [Rhypophila decipiens]
MQPLNWANQAAFLALLLLLPEIRAQSNTSNQNITLRFFQGNSDISCSYTDSDSALTFTAESIPLLGHCFDFRALFSGNKTQGFVNQTENLGSGLHYAQDPGIHWQLLNANDFDPQANYSKVLYRQHVTNPASDKYQPGHYADRVVTIYPGPGCRQLNPADNKTLLPWYGFSCWSEEQGSCGVLGYSIASFSIQPGREDDGRTCWVFAKEGSAPSLPSAAMAVLATVVLGLWFVV